MSKVAFLKLLKSYQHDNVFNPYTETCPLIDRHNADQLRRSNLSRVLAALEGTELDALWVGRDLGYRGGRRTGIPFTDETHMLHAECFWNVKLRRPCKGDEVTERSATNIWTMLSQVPKSAFNWNIFPFHPYEPGNPFSNRCHNSAEREAGLVILEALIDWLRPKKIIAIGNEANTHAKRVFEHKNIIKVRHPSYGGEKQFRQQIRAIYKLPAGN